jgi:uncharacterized protein
LLPTVQRVRRTALSIARAVSLGSEKKPDLLTVELSALLHDILDKKYVSADIAVDTYAFFRPFFQKMITSYGVDLISDGCAQTIAKIVDNISWTTETKLIIADQIEDWHRDTVELHCVQDADRLDAIGAIGELMCPSQFELLDC